MGSQANLFGEKVIGYAPTQPEYVPLPELPENRKPKNQQTAWNMHIKAGHVFVTPQWEHERSSANRHQLSENKKQLREKLSKTSAKKLTNAVKWMANTARWQRIWAKKVNREFMFKLNFITLTLPHVMWQSFTNPEDNSIEYIPSLREGEGFISDNFFKSVLLHKFINHCKEHCNLHNYVWKVESQINGNIHAHITTATFIDKDDVRKIWRNILNEYNLLEPFFLKHGHRDAPTTEIKAVRSADNVGDYLASELAKKLEGRRALSGRLWACSYELSKVHNEKMEIDYYDQAGYLKHLNECKTWRRFEIESKKKNEFSRPLNVGCIYAWDYPNERPPMLEKIYKAIAAKISELDIFNYCPEKYAIAWA